LVVCFPICCGYVVQVKEAVEYLKKKTLNHV